jgi:hypothetical protein
MTLITNVSGSYVQDQRHGNVSDKFNVVQAASVGNAMQNQGLQLVSLSTGKARQEDKTDFQRTLSRYRGPQIGDGVFLDLIYDSKHMGRGVDKILIGIYRLICTNGLFVGMNFFKHNIRHSGQTYENLDVGIAAALKTQERLAACVEKMQRIELTSDQQQALANEAVKLLTPSGAQQVKHNLLKTNRIQDDKNDLWTVYNRIQENAVQGRNIVYKLPRIDNTGSAALREMTARRIKPNTGKDADFNQELFNIAESLAA